MEYETRKYIEDSICSLPCSICPVREKYGCCMPFNVISNSDIMMIGRRALSIYKERYPKNYRFKRLKKIYRVKVM